MAERTRRAIAGLFAPVDAASLAVVRIALGLAIAWDVARYWSYGWIDAYYVLPKWTFPLLGGAWPAPWPGDGMYVHFAALGVAALAMAAGLWTRGATAATALLTTWVFLLEKSAYLNHHYLICLLCFLLLWMQPQRAFSLDRLRHPEWSAVAPRWNVLLLRFQLAVVYAFGAVAKLNADWLRGEPVFTALLHGDLVVPFASSLAPATLALAITWGGLAVDALVPVLLCVRRTRALGFAIAVSFHLANELLFRIGVFSWLMIAALPIFFAPDWPRRLRGRRTPAGGTPLPAPRRRLVLAGIALYTAAQILVPLRHWLYPGDVAWTEEGHRFSWRMKLRAKSGRLVLQAVDRDTGETWWIDPREDLTPRQWRKLVATPDLGLQYVHRKRDELRAEGVDVALYADWEVSLNGARPRLLADPEVDLARESASPLRTARWLLPGPRAR